MGTNLTRARSAEPATGEGRQNLIGSEPDREQSLDLAPVQPDRERPVAQVSPVENTPTGAMEPAQIV